MARFITVDTHFGHPGILNSCKKIRGHFKDVDEMNESIIKNWNTVVGGEDTIYHLGDIAVKMTNTSLFNILKRLNGKNYFC